MAVRGMTVAGRQAETAVWGCELEGRPMLLLPALSGAFLLAGLGLIFVRECGYLGMPTGIQDGNFVGSPQQERRFLSQKVRFSFSG